MKENEETRENEDCGFQVEEDFGSRI